MWSLYLDDASSDHHMIYTSVTIFHLPLICEVGVGAFADHIDYTMDRRMKVDIFILWREGVEVDVRGVIVGVAAGVVAFLVVCNVADMCGLQPSLFVWVMP